MCGGGGGGEGREGGGRGVGVFYYPNRWGTVQQHGHILHSYQRRVLSEDLDNNTRRSLFVY